MWDPVSFGVVDRASPFLARAFPPGRRNFIELPWDDLHTRQCWLLAELISVAERCFTARYEILLHQIGPLSQVSRDARRSFVGRKQSIQDCKQEQDGFLQEWVSSSHAKWLMLLYYVSQTFVKLLTFLDWFVPIISCFVSSELTSCHDNLLILQ